MDVKTDIFITERLLATTGVRYLLLVQENRSVKSVNFACRRFADNMPQGQFKTTEAIGAFYENNRALRRASGSPPLQSKTFAGIPTSYKIPVSPFFLYVFCFFNY